MPPVLLLTLRTWPCGWAGAINPISSPTTTTIDHSEFKTSVALSSTMCRSCKKYLVGPKVDLSLLDMSEEEDISEESDEVLLELSLESSALLFLLPP